MVPLVGVLASVAGGVASAARNLLSGKTSKARKELRQEKQVAKKAVKAATTQERVEEKKREATGITAGTTKANIIAFVKAWWWIPAIAIGLIIFVPKIIVWVKKKKVVSNPGSRAGSRSGSSKRKKSPAGAGPRKATGKVRKLKKGEKLSFAQYSSVIKRLRNTTASQADYNKYLKKQ